MLGFVIEQFECLLGSHIVVAGERQLVLVHSQVDLGDTVGYYSSLEWMVDSHIAELPA